jgi:UDP-N-acetylmuramoylalanine--D-glutamate ligase
MRRVVVVGAGRSGVAAANFLSGREVEVLITDSQPEAALPFVAGLSKRVPRILGAHPDSMLDGADLVVLSPGVPTTLPLLDAARTRDIPIISEIELAFRHLKGTVIAITGSNGKSTTTALIGEILRQADMNPVVAGNIGDPLVAAIDSNPRHYVIEISSFQLETVESFRPQIALLLNITPDHMDRYATIEEYAAAKNRIFRNQQGSDVAIVNADDPRTNTPPTRARVQRFSATRKADAYLDGDSLVAGDSRISRSALRIEGAPNVENALASWLAARAAGVGDDAVEKAFRSFQGLPHRMRLVRELAGVRYVNDSKGTNVDATLKSLEGMPDKSVFIILGGKDKKGEFERLRDLVGRKAKQVLTIGSAASRIEEALQGAAEIVTTGDLATAVGHAKARAKSGDVVLLSPACASFDQYRNFEHRGQHFEELVNAL